MVNQYLNNIVCRLLKIPSDYQMETICKSNVLTEKYKVWWEMIISRKVLIKAKTPTWSCYFYIWRNIMYTLPVLIFWTVLDILSAGDHVGLTFYQQIFTLSSINNKHW